jgi:NADH dehydrogenase
MKTKSQVVIVGAGFAGINAARTLAGHREISITIVDRRNHHLFQPLLYQVATAGLSPADIATPVRNLFSDDPNVTVLWDEAIDFSAKNNEVTLTDRTLSYDYLILACGANHSYFGRNEWEEFAPGLKTLEQATEIRRRILTAFEEAEKEADADKRAAWMNFLIIGGGPTGVELAGAIAELSRNTIRADFRRIDPADAKIILIEAGDRVLAAFDPKLSARAQKDLAELGVELRMNTRVTDLDAMGVTAGEVIASRTVIWAAGVAPSSTGKALQAQNPDVELDRSGRVIIQKDLSLKGYENVFVLGDQACSYDDAGKPLPGLAPVAMQQGRHAGKNILKKIAGRPTTGFRYLDKGIMATIGRKKAVVQTGKLQFTGWFAWITWLFIHIYYLIGFKNRVFVMIQWIWSYLTFSRGARLIISKDWRLKS